ncbi:DUF6233 domain-containing protein [Streptomyces ossamyceticus]|nr:DUF6233 domain-containing protein [Streptomyces ossamyceticus]
MSSPDTSPPPIRVTLPDGQQLLGVLHERRCWQLGGWMYWVGLPMWINNGPAEDVEPQEYRVWLKPAQATPVEGVSYDQVPTFPLPREDDGGDAADRWAWKIQRVPPKGGRPGEVVVHIWDCPEAPIGQPEVDLFDALDVLRSTPTAVACPECGAAVALDPLL